MKLNQFIDDAIGPILENREVSVDNVIEALENCMNSVISGSIHKNIKVVLTENDIKIYVENGHPPIRFDPNRISSDMVNKVREHLPLFIKRIEDDSRYNYWKPFRHKIREGYIIRVPKEKDRVDISLGNNYVGSMPRHFFSKHEKYAQGQSMMFYVAKVERPCQVILSRNSIMLPIAYLEDRMPLVNNNSFSCAYRIVGKCEIYSKVYIPQQIIDDLSRELRELVIVKIVPSLPLPGRSQDLSR
jgi:transcription antitermination factor NusA-like protein